MSINLRKITKKTKFYSALIGGIALLLSSFYFKNHWMPSFFTQFTLKEHTMNTFNVTSPIQIDEHILSQGQKLWFVKNESIGIISLAIRWPNRGIIFLEPQNKPGILTFLMDVLNESGFGKLNRVDFQNEVTLKRSSMSIFITSDDIQIDIQIPTEFLNEGFDLFDLFLSKPIFDNEDIHRAREKRIASLKQAAYNPESIAADAFALRIYGPNHPYSGQTLDFIKTTETVTVNELKDLFKKLLTQEGCHVAACGNVDVSLLKAKIESTLKKLPKNPPAPQMKSDAIIQNQGTIHHIEKDFPQSIIKFVHPGITHDHPDIFAISMLIKALGGTAFESRLWKEIREKRGLTYGIRIGNQENGLKHLLFGGMSTSPTSVDESLRLIKEEWKKAKEHGITQEELDLQKQYTIGRMPVAYNTSSGVVNNLLTYMELGYGKDQPAIDLKEIQAVKLEDVNRVARTFLNPDALTFVVVGQKIATLETKPDPSVKKS